MADESVSLASRLPFPCSTSESLNLSVSLAPHDLVQPTTSVFFFPLQEGQSSRIYLSEIKRRQEKKAMGASWRRDCISRRERPNGHTGQ